MATGRLLEKSFQEQKLWANLLRIHTRDVEDLRVLLFGDKGRGVVNLREFEKGEVVAVYPGLSLTKEEYEKATKAYEAAGEPGCFLFEARDASPGRQWFYDCTDESVYGKGLARYFNHSDDPNMYASLEKDVGPDTTDKVIVFRAIKDIPPLQELTYHYGDFTESRPWFIKQEVSGVARGVGFWKSQIEAPKDAFLDENGLRLKLEASCESLRLRLEAAKTP